MMVEFKDKVKKKKVIKSGWQCLGKELKIIINILLEWRVILEVLSRIDGVRDVEKMFEKIIKN